MEDIFRTFAKALENIPEPGRAEEILVFGAWNRCVNGQLARNLVPMDLKDKKLTAGVPSELWRRNVADLGPEIAARINRLLGRELVRFVEFQVVRDQRFELGAVGAHERISDEEWHAAARERITPELIEAAASIEDANLRAGFLAAAGSNLARQSLSDLQPADTVAVPTEGEGPDHV